MTKLEVPVPSLAAKKESAKRSAQAPHPFDNWKLSKQPHGVTGCITCKIHKVKCDEKKNLRVKDPRR